MYIAYNYSLKILFVNYWYTELFRAPLLNP